MTNMIDRELSRTVAREILLGGKTVDVAKIRGIKYANCRDYLHKHCKYVNSIAYEELAIEAVNQGFSSPPKSMLQEHKDKFLNEQVVSRSLVEVELELATVSADCESLERTCRELKCTRDQLRRELSDSQLAGGA